MFYLGRDLALCRRKLCKNHTLCLPNPGPRQPLTMGIAPCQGTGPMGGRQRLGRERRRHPKKESSRMDAGAGWAPWPAGQPIL